MIRVAFVIGDYPPVERRLREDVARSYSSADVEVGIVSVAARPFDGLGPAEIAAAAPLFHDAFRRAEREGYDAVVPLGMLDLGVDGGRAAVDIPVVAPLQAVLHVAAPVGERFVSAITPRRSRHRGRPAPTAWNPSSDGASAFISSISRRTGTRWWVVPAAARALIQEDGADVIIAQGITQCPVQMKPQWLTDQLGVPVVEGIGAPIRMAAMLVALGLRQSRVRWQKEGAQPL